MEKMERKRKREISQAEKRIAELDRIFRRVYKDNISGTISHERFLELSAEYEAEQKELTEKIRAGREMVNLEEAGLEYDKNMKSRILEKYKNLRREQKA